MLDVVLAAQSLAMPYDEQVRSEPDFVDLLFELEDGITGALEAIGDAVRDNLLSEDEFKDLQTLATSVTKIREDADPITYSMEGLQSAPEWEAIA